MLPEDIGEARFLDDRTAAPFTTVRHEVRRYGRRSVNCTNASHVANPSGTGLNVSQLQVNPDGSVRNLGGFSPITTTATSGRHGIDERVIRLGLRLGF